MVAKDLPYLSRESLIEEDMNISPCAYKYMLKVRVPSMAYRCQWEYNQDRSHHHPLVFPSYPSIGLPSFMSLAVIVTYKSKPAIDKTKLFPQMCTDMISHMILSFCHF
ncbi:hypothetical protein PNOK_0360300 [Pyrrhoderma noxium]|uniref:Uncharacterized protein n=1 Tax=Pyrrhoderma noxium TaxID=2282107 RepID=A0A286UN01_9AGAM|nr:hypothetical protein PNOK_0360300 [Pyrrhoderma noxium]